MTPLHDESKAPEDRVSPGAFAYERRTPVKDAARTSYTITGALAGLLGGTVMYLEDGIRLAVEVLSAMQELAPVKSLLLEFGGSARHIGFGVLIGGVALAILRRLEAAAKGKIG